MILQSHSWAYTQKKLKFEKIHIPQCSIQHYLQDMETYQTDDWIKKMWCIYTMEYDGILLRHKKRQCHMPFVNMNGPKDHHAK